MPPSARDLADFAPNIVHISAPDIIGHRAVSWARHSRIPAVASVHTRFDTYLAYYHLQSLEPLARGDHATHLSTLRRDPVSGGVDGRRASRPAHEPRHFDLDPRRRPRAVQSRTARHGVAAGASGSMTMSWSIAFLGRVVMEKGLDVFADAIDVLAERGVRHHVLVIGEGPARGRGSRTACRTRSSSVIRSVTICPERSPARTCSSTRRSPRRSATSRSRRWPARLPVVAAVGDRNHHARARRRDRHPGRAWRRRRASPTRSKPTPATPRYARSMAQPVSLTPRRTDWDSINSVVLKTYLRVISAASATLA